MRGYVQFSNYTDTHKHVHIFIPHASSSLPTEDGACGHRTAPFARPGVCKRALYRGVTGSDGREGAIGAGGGIGVGDRNGDGKWVGGGNGDVHGDGDGDGAGTRTRVEMNEGTQDGNADGSGGGDGNGDGSGDRWTNTKWKRGRKREQ